MKKFNLLISAQSTVQLNEEFPKEYELLRVTDVRKEVIKAVRSDGKTMHSLSTGGVPTIY